MNEWESQSALYLELHSRMLFGSGGMAAGSAVIACAGTLLGAEISIVAIKSID